VRSDKSRLRKADSGSPIVAVMQPAQSLLADHLTIPQRTRSASRCLLFQPEVRSVFVIVRAVIGDKAPQMSFRVITWSSNSRRQLPTQRSATPFCQGLPIEVCTGVIFSERIALGTSNPYFAS